MPVEEEQVQQFLHVIQGGLESSVDSVETVTADNGSSLFNIVNKTTYAWNGLVAQAQAIVAVGATAVASGVALLTAPVSAPVVAVGLALGLTSGYLLYDLQPEFFDNVAAQLEAAGQTVGGKVISFIDEHGNTGYTQETIDIIKNALLQYGAYDSTIVKPELPASQQTLRIPYIDYYNRSSTYDMRKTVYEALNLKHFINGLWSRAGDCYDRFKVRRSGGTVYMDVPLSSLYLIAWKVAEDSYNQAVLATELSDDIVNNRDVCSWEIISSATGSSYTGSRFTSNLYKIGEKWYWINYDQVNRNTIQNNNITPDICPDISNTSFAIMGLLYKMIVEPPQGVQDGATLPTGDPISTTYPDWNQWPDIAPLPDYTIYPVSWPIPDGLQDEAQTGDNDNPDQIKRIWNEIFIPDPPSPSPTPDPPPVPDPDPQPVDPDPIPVPDPEPVPPIPPDPNPPVPPSPTPIVPALPAMVDSNAMFTVYRPSISQLNSFGGWLWSSSIIDQLLRMWSNPLEGIIAFQKVYASPTIGASSNIIVGYLDSEVAAPVVTSQFTAVDCGTIDIAEKMHNATDYSPYTSMHLYLPFIGIVELDITEFMNGSINVKYSIDVYTGTCLAEVRSIRQVDMPNATIIYTFSGNASQQLPLTSSNFAGALSALVSAVGGGIAIASGGGLTALAGATAIGHSVAHEMVHIGRSGALSANAGIMAARKPFIILGRRNGYDANAYNELYGYPANKTVYLSNCDGFTRVKAGFLRSKATENEKAEIMSFLKKGVIL